MAGQVSHCIVDHRDVLARATYAYSNKFWQRKVFVFVFL
jgi:hypothetical protein